MPYDACAAAARELRQITGFDRVDVYRFAADATGEVIAESRTDTIDSFLGLHFPASDIPAQARALYRINPLRIIPDIDYTPVPILPGLNPATGKPIDLTYAVLRTLHRPGCAPGREMVAQVLAWQIGLMEEEAVSRVKNLGGRGMRHAACGALRPQPDASGVAEPALQRLEVS